MNVQRPQAGTGEQLTQIVVVKAVQMGIGRRQPIAVHAQVIDDRLTVWDRNQYPAATFRDSGRLAQTRTRVFEVLDNLRKHDSVEALVREGCMVGVGHGKPRRSGKPSSCASDTGGCEVGGHDAYSCLVAQLRQPTGAASKVEEKLATP
jgi:hypothetical protein